MMLRSLAFVAIIGLLVSQLAAIPHAHEGMTATEQQEHAANPHFHTGDHAHHHGHHHDGHFHHHGSPGAQPTDEEPSDRSPEDFAVYCSPDIDVLLISKTISFDGNQHSSPFVEVVATISPVPNHVARHWHPPDADWPGSHLYLSLRNLRL